MALGRVAARLTATQPCRPLLRPSVCARHCTQVGKFRNQRWFAAASAEGGARHKGIITSPASFQYETRRGNQGERRRGIRYEKNVAMLYVYGEPGASMPQLMQRTMSKLDEVKVKVKLVAQASSERKIALAIDEGDTEKALDKVSEIYGGMSSIADSVGDLSCVPGYSIVSIDGRGLRGNEGEFAQVAGAFLKARVAIKALTAGSSDREMAVVVKTESLDAALEAVESELHDFDSPKPEVSVGIIGYGVVGTELVDQIGVYNRAETGSTRILVRGIADIDKMVLHKDGIHLRGDATNVSEVDPAAEVSDVDLDKFASFVKDGAKKAILVDVTASGVVSAMYPKWLKQGISVITPNKKAGSADMAFYREVKDAARVGGSDWKYEVTVGAGLPIIKTCQEMVRTGDEVLKIEGIFSGTLSYIFNSMKGGRQFSEVVADAKANGFTEPDPRDDLSGTDVQRKSIILARECGLELNMEDVPVESLVPEPLREWKPAPGENMADAFIAALKPYDKDMDVKLKAAGDGVLRFVGSVDVVNKKAEVALRAYPADHPFAGTKHSDNIILFSTKRYTPQPLVVQGPGAGAAVTAAGLFAELFSIVKITF